LYAGLSAEEVTAVAENPTEGANVTVGSVNEAVDAVAADTVKDVSDGTFARL